MSSVIRGFEPFREAAADASRVLGHEVLRSEDLPASPDAAERACLELARRADVVLTILGARYGAATGRGLSPTHQEYREAVAQRKDVLGFVQTGIIQEPEQKTFGDEVRQWATGIAVASFSTPAELRNAVTRALKELEVSRSAGRADPDEMLRRAEQRARELGGNVREAALVVAVAPGPAQAVIRAPVMAGDAFQRELEKDALYGEPPVLVRGEAVGASISRGSLTIEQRQARIALDLDGTIAIAVPPMRRDDRVMLPALVHEDLQDAIADALRFAGRTLDRIDPGGRISDVVPVASLAKVGYSGWRTRAEQERDRNRLTMNVAAADIVTVALRPPSRRRRALVAQAMELSEDLTELLRQEVVR